MQADAPKVVAIEQEPRHKPVFREGTVRILDVQIPPGDVTLYHTHETAILYVPISISPTDSQILGQEWLGVKPGDRSRFEGLVLAADTSYALKAVTHRVKNVGNRPFRLIAITNAAMPGEPAKESPPGKPVHTSRWYAASQLVVSPSSSSEWQVAAKPTVVVLPVAGRVRLEQDKGGTDLKEPGAWGFVGAGVRYRVVNTGTEAGSLVLVQANQ